MIYAVVIIVALAATFIILIRRLPRAVDLTSRSSTRRSEPVSSDLPSAPQPKPIDREPIDRATSPNRPRFKLPKLNLSVLANFISKIKLPALLKRNSRPKQERQPSSSDSSKQGINTMARPANQINQAAKQPADLQPAPPRPASFTEPIDQPMSKEDFWEQAGAPQPVNEPIATQATARKSAERPTKGRNIFQEAEDAFAVKDYKKAERLYIRLAAEDPKNAKIYGRLGVIYLEQKNFEDARDAFQVALKLEPNVAPRHFNLALTYLQLGSKAKAMSAMEAALKYDPSNRKYRKILDDILAGRI